MLNPPNDQHLSAGYAGQLHRTPHEQMLGRVDPIWLYRAEGSATSTPRLGETVKPWGKLSDLICKSWICYIQKTIGRYPLGN